MARIALVAILLVGCQSQPTRGTLVDTSDTIPAPADLPSPAQPAPSDAAVVLEDVGVAPQDDPADWLGLDCEPQEADMVPIPAGTFLMGCQRYPAPLTGAEGFGLNCEVPPHLVYLDAFEIDRRPVSVGEYLRCTGAGHCGVLISVQYGPTQMDVPAKEWAPMAENMLASCDQPLGDVSWNQAVSYCAWAGKPEGAQRLCTDADWEKAASGGCALRGCAEDDFDCCLANTPPLPWGDTPLDVALEGVVTYYETDYTGCPTTPESWRQRHIEMYGVDADDWMCPWPKDWMPIPSPYGVLSLLNDIGTLVHDIYMLDADPDYWVNRAAGEMPVNPEPPGPGSIGRVVRGGVMVPRWALGEYTTGAARWWVGLESSYWPTVGFRCCR